MTKKGYKQTEEHRRNIGKAMSEALKGYKQTIEHRRNIGKSAKNNPNFGMGGKHFSEESKQKIGLGNKGKIRSEEAKKNYSEAQKGHKKTEEHRRNISEARIKLWEDEEYREKQIEAILKGLMKRPTSYEKKISELCIENSLPFVYTGDGRFLINYKNPDFVDKQNKVVIEVFYSWFKIRDYGSVDNYKEFCKKKYNPTGWTVIFIDENEVNVENWKELCLNKIKRHSK